MLYREIIAVCSEIHTEHVSTLCGQTVRVELLNVKLVLRIIECPLMGRNFGELVHSMIALNL
jgi:hypothetical protein